MYWDIQLLSLAYCTYVVYVKNYAHVIFAGVHLH